MKITLIIYNKYDFLCYLCKKKDTCQNILVLSLIKTMQ